MQDALAGDTHSLEDARRESVESRDMREEPLDIDTLVVQQLEGTVRSVRRQ